MILKERYGPLALVAGASKGLGAAFARELAGEGFNLVIVARNKEDLETTARELILKYSVQVLPVSCDLNDPDATEQIQEMIGDRMVNFLVYNAARPYIGSFLNNPVPEHLQIAAVNMLTPLKMIHHFGGRMVKEKKGGIVLMSSLAGNQGSGFLATYAATKAFNRVLAESLWYEWKSKGVDVIGCIAGSILTPNFIQSNPDKISPFAPKPQLAEEVVKECFSKIGRKPSFISGGSNKVACFLMNRLFSVKRAVNLMSNTTKKMYRIHD
jgi:short-subunit dehydrogenase